MLNLLSRLATFRLFRKRKNAPICSCLLCMSATHTDYGSIRMELMFMFLGQSAATEACIAIDKDADVQKSTMRILNPDFLLTNKYCR